MTATVNTQTSHNAVISIVVILVVVFVLVTVAGVNGDVGKWGILLLGSALLLSTMGAGNSLLASVSKYPWIP